MIDRAIMHQAHPLDELIYRRRGYLLAACVAAIVVGFLLNELSLAPTNIAMAIKLLPVFVLAACAPWMTRNALFLRDQTPRSLLRVYRLSLLVLLLLYTGMLTIGLIAVFGINCEPTATEITAALFWSAVGLTLLLFGPAHWARIKRRLRHLAHHQGVCYECGYDLSQIPGDTCPECGYQSSESPTSHDPPAEPAVN